MEGRWVKRVDGCKGSRSWSPWGRTASSVSSCCLWPGCCGFPVEAEAIVMCWRKIQGRRGSCRPGRDLMPVRWANRQATACESWKDCRFISALRIAHKNPNSGKGKGFPGNEPFFLVPFPCLLMYRSSFALIFLDRIVRLFLRKAMLRQFFVCLLFLFLFF